MTDDIRRRYIVESAEKLRRIPRRFREHLGEALSRISDLQCALGFRRD